MLVGTVTGVDDWNRRDVSGKAGGTFLAMKSVESDQELASAGHAIATLGGAVAAVRDYVIPGTQVRHRLIIVEKAKKTPEKYPRMFAKIKKNPL